ncbi:Telomeric repeat-binding factor 2 [Jeotgalicoccus saudimassiliensis]|uniref:Telomeric repeat-binding factor 2 n=1 Tax=Jeotgalicoccus saudimassiliensis TaxID=1461582 RepID=A0A078LV98_9STAP|nr:Telomeric repeat-binding factor 2 [Jeotgalicoccus saudimassiliensis]
MKKLILLALMSSLALAACGNESEETDNEESMDDSTEATAETEDENQSGAVYEIGDTAQVESFEWEIEYEVTVNSFDQVPEYNGKALDEFVGNAPDTAFLGVVNMTVKNISDEPIVIGEYVYPDVTQGTREGGDQFLFDLSEEDLSKELQPDQEATFDLVYSMVTDAEVGQYSLKFENGMPTETVFRLPIE